MGAGNNLITYPNGQGMDAQEPRGKRVNKIVNHSVLSCAVFLSLLPVIL